MAKLDKNTALKLSEPIEDAYLACVDRLIVNIAKHLGSGTAIRTGAWETGMLEKLGQLTEENARIINEATKRVPQEIRQALSEASKLALADVERSIEEAIKRGDLERAPTDSVQGLLDDLAGQAVEQANLVNTVMLESGQSAYLHAVNNTVSWVNQALDREAAQGIMNEAATAVTLATETRQQALKKAISQMADNGIYGFVDRAGRHWSPEAYINMDIRTTAHNAAIQSIRARQEDYGSDIFQISSHPGARPLCYPYQGKFYSWHSGAGTFTDGAGARHQYAPITDTSYGQPAGIFGINCGHYPLPQIPRVTIPQDKPEQDKEDNDREYLMSQQQRALERDVRNAKRRAAAFDAAGLRDAFNEEAVRVREKRQAYRDFCRKTGRSERLDRLGVAGYTRSVSQKATAAARNEQSKYRSIHFHKDGTIVVTDDWTNKKSHLPAIYKPNAVVDTVSGNKKQRDRSIYDENGRLKLQINSGPHSNPKRHPFGKQGEHAHDIVWENDKIISRNARELTEEERKEHADIL